MKVIRLNVTTNTAGAGTAFGDATNGVLYAVQLVDGDFADGVDITLTAEQGELSIPLLTKADFNTDQMVYPRVLESLSSDGTALTTHAYPVVIGRPKAVVAAGGAVKSGTFVLYVVDL